MRPPFIPVAAMLATAVLAAACTNSGAGPGGPADAAQPTGSKMSVSAPAGSRLEKILQADKITIGVKNDVPQFGVKNPTNNQVEGFEVDLAKYVGLRLLGDANKANLVEALNANRVPMLDGDKADLIISQMTITPERRQQVLFTDVYYIGQLRILAKKDTQIANAGDLGGMKVCTSAGSTAIPVIQTKAPTATIVSLKSNTECFDAVSDGRVDAEVADDSSLVGFIVKDPRLELKGEPLAEAPYGAAAKKGNEPLVDAVNKIIEDYKSSGQWKQSYSKWMQPLTKINAEPPAKAG
jgi:putative glutamine transport system substrate-binding protein